MSERVYRWDFPATWRLWRRRRSSSCRGRPSRPVSRRRSCRAPCMTRRRRGRGGAYPADGRRWRCRWLRADDGERAACTGVDCWRTSPSCRPGSQLHSDTCSRWSFCLQSGQKIEALCLLARIFKNTNCFVQCLAFTEKKSLPPSEMSGSSLAGPAALRSLRAAITIALLGQSGQCPISTRWRQTRKRTDKQKGIA